MGHDGYRAEDVAKTAGSETGAVQQSRESMSQHAISEAIKAATSSARTVGSEDYTNPIRTATTDTSSAHVPGLMLDNNSDLPKSKMTFVVDLTTDLQLDDGTVAGAQRAQEQLKQLAEESKGHPGATIVIQAIDKRPEKSSSDAPANATPADAATNATSSDAPASAASKTTPMLSRYIIHDGVITPAEKVASKGMAGDVEDLLKYASQNAPSDSIALAIKSHGDGGAGITGGTGHATLLEVTEAIRSGLKGSGHDRLDVLDFDSCIMSAPSVLSAVHSAADHVVASQEPETAGKTFDGQNLNAALTDLLRNPGMSPVELSKDLVEKANHGATPEVGQSSHGDTLKHVGADTLASYESSEFKQFHQAMNELGGLLSKSAQNDESRKAIVDIIDKTKRLPTENSDPNPYRDGYRDLKDFVSDIKAGAERGTISDADGSIARAAQNVLDGQSKMTEAYSGSAIGGYDKLGGLYTFLPVSEVRNGSAAPLQLMAECATDNNFADKNDIVHELEQLKTEVTEQVSDSTKAQFQPVIDTITKIKEAQDEGTFQSAMRGLGETVKALQGSDVDKELKDHLLKAEDVSGADQWNEFIRQVS